MLPVAKNSQLQIKVLQSFRVVVSERPFPISANLLFVGKERSFSHVIQSQSRLSVNPASEVCRCAFILYLHFPVDAHLEEIHLFLYAQEASVQQVGGDSRGAAARKGVENPGVLWRTGKDDSA